MLSCWDEVAVRQHGKGRGVRSPVYPSPQPLHLQAAFTASFPPYIPSINSAYLRLTRLRFNFIVGVSSSSSAVNCYSSKRNCLICSTRAKALLTFSTSAAIRPNTSGARHRLRKSLNGKSRCCAHCLVGDN